MLTAYEKEKMVELEHRAATSLSIAERAESKGSMVIAQRMFDLAAESEAAAAVLRSKEALMLDTKKAFDRAQLDKL